MLDICAANVLAEKIAGGMNVGCAAWESSSAERR